MRTLKSMSVERGYGSTMGSIIFARQGHIGVHCLRVLQKGFRAISIMNGQDKQILELRRDSDEVIDNFHDSDSKYVFMAGWTPLITIEELDAKTFINIHGSLLPKYRGTHSIFWAIMNFENELGYTIHEVNRNIDDGDIIYQYRFRHENQTIGEIHKLFHDDLSKNLVNVLSKYMSNEIVARPQDKRLATWCPKRNLTDCVVDFTWPNAIIDRFFLALTPPYPLPRIIIRSIMYEVLEFRLLPADYFCDVGRVVNIDEEGVWIKTKEGLMIVSRVRNTENQIVADPRKLLKVGYRFKHNM